jgi:hypothetical protein
MVWWLVLGFVVLVWYHHNVNPTAVVINGVLTPIVPVPVGDNTVNIMTGQFSYTPPIGGTKI